MLKTLFEVSTELFAELEEFTCKFNDSKTIKDINQLRYAIFCAKREDYENFVIDFD